MPRTLLQIEQMIAAHQLSTSTLNALHHQVHVAREPIDQFLARTEKYRKNLGGGGKGWEIAGGMLEGGCSKKGNYGH